MTSRNCKLQATTVQGAAMLIKGYAYNPLQ